MTVRGIFLCTVCACSGYAFVMDILFGILYSACAMSIIWFSRKKVDKLGYLFAVSIAFVCFYLLRPLVLWGNDGVFNFTSMGDVPPESHYFALIELVGFIWVVFLGMKFGIGRAKPRSRGSISIDKLVLGRSLFLSVSLAGVIFSFMASGSGKVDGAKRRW
jgi:hypothetical protein